MQPENSPEFPSPAYFFAGNSLNYGFPATENLNSSSFYPLETFEFGEKPETRSCAASENHKEAERRRRERINGHLDRLRAILFCNSKTDKASLLAKVVDRVRELKQQTSQIMQFDQLFPSEADEIAVLLNNDSADGRTVVEASLCCEDRVDLIPDLIEILQRLHLRPLKAEMVTLGGRMRNVVVLACEKDQTDKSVLLLKDALKTLLLRSNYIGAERSRKRRMFDQRIIG